MDKLPERASLLAPPKAAGASAHSDLSTILSIYSHQDASELNRAMEKQAVKAVRDSETVETVTPAEISAITAWLSRKVEAAGIEPAQDFNRRTRRGARRDLANGLRRLRAHTKAHQQRWARCTAHATAQAGNPEGLRAPGNSTSLGGAPTRARHARTAGNT